MINENILSWFEREKGILPETLEEFGIKQEGDYIVFPFVNGEKRRKDPTKSNRRVFLYTNGKSPDLFHNLNRASRSKVAFLVEGETDTLRLSQELRTSLRGLNEHNSEQFPDVFGLSGVETWKPIFESYFAEHEKVFVILDNDLDYSVKSRVDTIWRQIKRNLGKKAKRVVLPTSVKDVCEFFDNYSMENFQELCKRESLPNYSLNLLDLTKEPPEMDWLVQDLICRGDVNLLTGSPGIGKSWLTLDLATKLASGRPTTWLGHDVVGNGKILYIDEENPEDIIYHRFKKLGLTNEIAKNIFFAYRPGIWLNKDPEILLEEALEIEPSLIVLDSLSRIQSGDENNANEMAKLFRNAITPLARETNGAVIVIHHTIKGDAESGFQRARGSGDITAVVDAAIEVTGSDRSGRIFVSQFKSRRRAANDYIVAEIKDISDDKVTIEAQYEEFIF